MTQQQMLAVDYEQHEPDYYHYANRIMFEDNLVADPSDEEEVRDAAEEYAEMLVLDEERLKKVMLKICENTVTTEIL